ncbi:MAG TPA: hypothetical protein EYN51_01430, partial [Flavobacteriales bacterium]|nr:hypothetical protein [Flavobacteriales bacterium]
MFFIILFSQKIPILSSFFVTQLGKTKDLASALGRAACQADYNVPSQRTSRLLQALELTHADGSYPQLMRKLARTH